jgi:hypothetical protein
MYLTIHHFFYMYYLPGNYKIMVHVDVLQKISFLWLTILSRLLSKVFHKLVKHLEPAVFAELLLICVI